MASLQDDPTICSDDVNYLSHYFPLEYNIWSMQLTYLGESFLPLFSCFYRRQNSVMYV